MSCDHQHTYLSEDKLMRTCKNNNCRAQWEREKASDPFPAAPTRRPVVETDSPPETPAVENELSWPRVETPSVKKETPAAPAAPAASSIPPKPRGNWALHRYYQENRQAIVADYQAMKLRDYLKKWGMSPGTWAKLRADWEVPFKQPNLAHKPREAQPEVTPTPQSEVGKFDAETREKFGTPPELPPWDSSWNEAVKVMYMHSLVTLRIITGYAKAG